MTNFELLSLVIAIAALAQPWVMAAWEKWFRRGRLDIYPTGRAEIGYSNFGPLVRLHGTLRAENQEIFVTSMAAIVTRLSDTATRTLEWLVFLPDRVGGANEAFACELAHPFLIASPQPCQYHIAFRSPEFEREIQVLLIKVQEEWQKHPINEERLQISEAHGNISPEFGRRATEAFQEFSQTPLFIQTYTEIERRCFWEPGKYRIKVLVYTAQREEPFLKEWCIEVSEEESRRLRLNAITMLHHVCDQAAWPYNLVYPDYKSPD